MKPGPATLEGGQTGCRPAAIFCGDGLGDLARGLVERAGTGHGNIGCDIAVLTSAGISTMKSGSAALGQGTVSDGCLDGIGQQRTRLCQRRRTGL